VDQDGVSNDPEPCSCDIIVTEVLHTRLKQIGSGSVYNMKVCVLGSVSMLGQHILLFNSWPSHSPLFFGQFFLRFENQSFPNFLCSKSCNSVITHPSARPPKKFRKHVVLLEIPYPRMCFF
jgi:hypothetical protein